MEAQQAPEAGKVRTVEKDPRGGWIARCPWSGFEIMEPGWRWNSRSVARCVVAESRIFGPNKAWEDRQRTALSRSTSGGKPE